MNRSQLANATRLLAELDETLHLKALLDGGAAVQFRICPKSGEAVFAAVSVLVLAGLHDSIDGRLAQIRESLVEIGMSPDTA